MTDVKRQIRKSVKKARRTADWAKRELLDKKILNLASARYRQVKKQINDQKERLTQESQIVYDLGEKILNRAKKVRTNLQPTEIVKVTKKTKSKIQKDVVNRAMKVSQKTKKKLSSIKKKKTSKKVSKKT